MSSKNRVLGLIELFTEARPIWTADALIQTRGTSRATTYRDLKALVASGFLAPVAAGAYALGPRFIELDRQIRLADPLLKIAPPIMAAQRAKVAGTQLLCRYYGLRVMSIHEDRFDERIKTSFDRGRPFFVVQGLNVPNHPGTPADRSAVGIYRSVDAARAQAVRSAVRTDQGSRSARSEDDARSRAAVQSRRCEDVSSSFRLSALT